MSVVVSALLMPLAVVRASLYQKPVVLCRIVEILGILLAVIIALLVIDGLMIFAAPLVAFARNPDSPSAE